MYILVENAKGELNAKKFIELSPAQKAMREFYNEKSIFPLQEIHEYEAVKMTDPKNIVFSWRIFDDSEI